MDILDIMMAKKLAGGGGGGTESVKYIPQSLTESQQMQARKNQGLYYNAKLYDEIVWDGNTDGKVSFELLEYTLYKISDAVLTLAQLENSKLMINGSEWDIDVYPQGGGVYMLSGVNPETSLPAVQYNIFSGDAGEYQEFGITFIVPENGTYATFAMAIGTETIQSATLTNNAGFVTKKIEPNFLPTGGFGYEEFVPSREPIEWNGDTDGRTVFVYSGINYYKVSDSVFTKNDLIGGMMYVQVDGVTTHIALTDPNLTEYGGMLLIYGGMLGISAVSGSHPGGIATPEDGTYFTTALFGDGEYTSVTIRLEFPPVEVVHHIESKYIPDDFATQTYVNQQIAAQDTETWTFTLDDDTTVTKQVLVKAVSGS